jgi:hypothetical protein
VWVRTFNEKNAGGKSRKTKEGGERRERKKKVGD